MTTEFLNIIPSKFCESTQAVQYTVASSPTVTSVFIIDSFTVTNVTSSSVTFSCNIVNSGDSAGSSNLIVATSIVGPNSSFVFPELIGQTLSEGQFISTLCGTASALVIRASGRLISN